MKIRFSGELQELQIGIKVLEKRLGYIISEEGIPVTVKQASEGIRVYGDKSGAVILYQEQVQFFRALGLLLEHLKSEEPFDISESPNFKTIGTMVDVSRNAVLTVESVKTLLETIAIMGMNMFMLYTEDTYEMEKYPYFGYMRGRYTYEELKELDDYADALGIEMSPCIQTLGHLFAALKWDACSTLRDTDDILLVDDEQTYQFIEDMIRAASKPFRSKKIHIGMDEAYGIGLGSYLSKHGYRPTFDLMCEHLERVKGIAAKYDLEPIIWSDMFFQAASSQHSYYDTEVVFTEELVEKVPKDVMLAYWDYQHESQEHYEKMIQKHRGLGNDLLFAGAVLTWIGMAVNYDITFVAATAALRACKAQKVDKVIATMWGDDGAETNYFSALLGLQLYAEYAYQSEEVTDELLAKRFMACTGESMGDFLAISKLDCIATHEGEKVTDTSNPSKYLLFQDVLIGLFDRHVEHVDIAAYYTEIAEELKTARERAGEFQFVFDVPLALANALKVKSDIGVRVTKAYRGKDLKTLQRCVDVEIPKIQELVLELRDTHRTQWLKTYKPFGWEVLDIRYGGVVSRLDTAIYRLKQYLNGEIAEIPELEERRLGFDMESRPKGAGFGRGNTYNRIVTACPMGLHK